MTATASPMNSTTVLLGCIADDVTGATDVASALRRAGMTVTLLFDVPRATAPAPQTDAVVLALTTRMLPPEDAVSVSLAGLRWLRMHGAERVFFKYCSTFDSTPRGNIGPVTDALLEALEERLTVICPASPEHGRTMYQGHLFVGDRLLSESPLRDHPLTPMTDPHIPRFLQQQTPSRVGLVSLSTIHQGPGAVEAALRALAEEGVRQAVVDAVSEEDLATIATGAKGLRLLTGGAGLAGALGSTLMGHPPADQMAPKALPAGPAVVLAGSCSAATIEQVGRARAAMPSYRLDPAATPEPDAMLERARTWLRQNVGQRPALIYSTADAAERAVGRAAMGPETSAHLEHMLGLLAEDAVAHGVSRVVVAGGETSGAVVRALGIEAVVIGGEAARGVPWCLARDRPVTLLLKSGNFGDADLLVRAAEQERA